MARWAKRVFWTLAALLLAPLLAALLLYAFADTGLGRGAIESLVSLISGGDVKIARLEGSFPYTPHLGHVEIRDQQGVWLVLDDVDVAWSPWDFLGDHIVVTSAHVRHAKVLRLPVSSSTDNTPGTTRYEIGSAKIDTVEFGPALTGRTFTAALSARGHYTNNDDAQWSIQARTNNGVYSSDGNIDAQRIAARLVAQEAPHGFLGGLAGVPDVGALSINATIDGVRSLELLDAAIAAGPARLTAKGFLDLQERKLQIDVSGHSPAMAPRPDLFWQSFGLEGHVKGSFDAPEAYGRLDVDSLRAFGVSARSITGDLSGYGGAINFTGQAEGLRIPGPDPGVFSASPLKFGLRAKFGGAYPEAEVSATHPLASLQGHIAFASATNIKAHMTLARVAPFAALGGVELDGRAVLDASATLAPDGDSFAANGTLDAYGPALLSRLVGRDARIAFAAKTSATGFAVDKATIASSSMAFDAKGALTGATLDFSYTASLHDLSRLANTLAGHLDLQGRVQGDVKNFSLESGGSGSIATKDHAQGPVTLNISATGLPNHAAGTLALQGRMHAAPLQVSAAFQPAANGGHAVALQSLAWRSVRANGDFLVPNDARRVTGKAEFHIGELADIGLLIGQTLKGALHGAIDITAQNGRAVSRIHATATNAGIPGVSAQTLAIDGNIADPLGTPGFALTLKANGLSTNGVTGNATAKADGPLDQVKFTLQADLKSGTDEIPVVADATADFKADKATLARFETNYRGEPLRLTAPAHIDFANGLAVDRLQMLSNTAEIDVAGRITPKLAADVTLRGASPKLIRIFVPALDAEGSISGNAKLTGTLQAPAGTVSVQASGFRLRGEASGLPPATVTANGTLHGKSMTLTARIDAGKSMHLALDGTAPLEAAGKFDLKATGTLDLVALDPMLAASGRRLRGTVAVDGRFFGNFDAPRASGSAVLGGGEYTDTLQGIRLTDIAAHLDAKGDTITVSSLTGRAGHGTFGGHGTVALWADGIPLDLAITMKNARPLATDLFNADIDADLKVTGNLRDQMQLSGTARIQRGEINIAESYPPEVAVLDVRHSRTQPAPKRPAARRPMTLDLKVRAQDEIYVRGHGLDAEVGGYLSVKGDSAAPLVTGGFTMRRGDLSLAGQTIEFSSGKITFDGRSLNGSFDPALDFDAQSTSGSVTAKLNVTGHASTPKIALSSTPSLPQDEVLAHLLFGQSVAQLSALQLAQIAQAFAELGGVGGGFNPVGALRKTLGLDRLAVGSTPGGNGATVELGKNIGHNVYAGAKQSTSGGTQAIVQVDLTRHLKLQSIVTAVASAAPTTGTAVKQENGSSIGITYEFEY